MLNEVCAQIVEKSFPYVQSQVWDMDGTWKRDLDVEGSVQSLLVTLFNDGYSQSDILLGMKAAMSDKSYETEEKLDLMCFVSIQMENVISWLG